MHDGAEARGGETDRKRRAAYLAAHAPLSDTRKIINERAAAAFHAAAATAQPDHAAPWWPICTALTIVEQQSRG